MTDRVETRWTDAGAKKLFDDLEELAARDADGSMGYRQWALAQAVWVYERFTQPVLYRDKVEH